MSPQGFDLPQKTKLLGRLDTRMVRVVMGKPAEKDSETFSDVNEVGSRCIEEMSETLAKGGRSAIADPFASTKVDQVKKETKVKDAKQVQATRMLQFTASGEVVNAHRMSHESRGISVGCFLSCEENEDGLIIKVLEMMEDGSCITAKIAEDGSETKSVVDISPQDLAKWVVSKAPSESFMPNSDHNPLKNTSYADGALKAHVTSALHFLSSQLPEVRCKIQTKPARVVFADNKYAKDSLQLCFDTCKITTTALGAPAPSKSVAVQLPIELGAKSCYLTQHIADDFCAVAWMIRASEDAKEANLEVRYKVIKLTLSCAKCEQKDVSLKMPYLTNSKVVNAGDELIVYRQSSVAKRDAAKVEAAPSKKAKKS